jgi:hypothetical protein
MMRKVLLAGASAMAFSALVSATAVDATTITFPYPNGTPITTIGIATFSLQDGAYGNPAYAAGAPVTGSFGAYGQLGNSQTGEYPTAAILDVSFSSPVSNISFTFDNFGYNFSSFAATYGAGHALLGSTGLGDPGCAYGCSRSVAGSGVTDLQFNNGEGTSRSWEFGVSSISFTSVPEPSTWAMLFGGFGFIGYVLRRRVLRAVA